ncbi:hypothetical protein CEXT_342031 [Caerostris extrusa]|uniref:Uncharacterized protein n=1 Tax=Caerostris extrusa TaxID=172846 RepID=A0AAV4P8T6_CAEEX|nr:hypothetical protein CEXT_342031 [Caerostris extrusa]
MGRYEVILCPNSMQQSFFACFFSYSSFSMPGAESRWLKPREQRLMDDSKMVRDLMKCLKFRAPSLSLSLQRRPNPPVLKMSNVPLPLIPEA